MWVQEHKVSCTGISATDVWRVLTEIDRWPEWHDDLMYCKLQGGFAVGSMFVLKPKQGPAVKIELIDIQPGREFTDLTRFFGAKMYDTHRITEGPDGVTIENKVVVTGPLSWLWVKLVAQQVADASPQEIDALVQVVRNSEPIRL